MGKLPRLHVNFSDQKYKSIMKILGIVLSLLQGPAPSSTANTASNFLQSETIASHSTDSDYMIRKDSDNDSFFDAEEEVAEEIRPQKPAVAVTDPPEKVLLSFTFEVGQVSALLSKSGSSLDSMGDKSLAELKISGFTLNVRMRPHDLGVKVDIQSISIEDQLHLANPASTEKKYLLHPSIAAMPSPVENLQKLISVQYSSMKPLSPQYSGIDQIVDASFASVDVNLVQDSVLSLYDFILATFTTTTPVTQSKDALVNDTLPQASPSTGQLNMEIRTKMTSVNIIVIENDTRLATTSFGAGKMDIKFKQGQMSVTGRLGNLSIVDNVLRSGESRQFDQLLRIEGQEVADFVLQTYSPLDSNYPGYDTSLKLKTSSFRFTYIEPLLKDLQRYFQEFQRMHVLLSSARKAAADTQETAGKFHYDLHLETPIIEFPVFSYTSKQMVIMYL
jgi:vacuolar protein sorting-associated protein 13A/C